MMSRSNWYYCGCGGCVDHGAAASALHTAPDPLLVPVAHHINHLAPLPGAGGDVLLRTGQQHPREASGSDFADAQLT